MSQNRRWRPQPSSCGTVLFLPASSRRGCGPPSPTEIPTQRVHRSPAAASRESSEGWWSCPHRWALKTHRPNPRVPTGTTPVPHGRPRTTWRRSEVPTRRAWAKAVLTRSCPQGHPDLPGRSVAELEQLLGFPPGSTEGMMGLRNESDRPILHRQRTHLHPTGPTRGCLVSGWFRRRLFGCRHGPRPHAAGTTVGRSGMARLGPGRHAHLHQCEQQRHCHGRASGRSRDRWQFLLRHLHRPGGDDEFLEVPPRSHVVSSRPSRRPQGGRGDRQRKTPGHLRQRSDQPGRHRLLFRKSAGSHDRHARHR